MTTLLTYAAGALVGVATFALGYLAARWGGPGCGELHWTDSE